MLSVSKKTVNKKRKRTNADYIRLFVGVLVIGGFLFTLVSQQLRISSIRRETKQYEERTAVLEKEYDKLSKKEKYNSTDASVERKARDEGYVRSDETVFVVGN